MQATAAAKAGIDPAKALPPSWDLEHDALLIIGEKAGIIAEAFVAHGLKRVITMYPPPMKPEAATPGAFHLLSHASLPKYIGTILHNHPQRFAVIVTPQCSLDPQLTKDIEKRFRRLLLGLSGRTKAQDGLTPRWAMNGMKNLPHLANNPMFHDLGDAFRGKPVIIVGAGPSLAKNIDQLKAAQEKCIILCANRALRSLQRAGIWPDIAINIETQDVKCQFDDIDLSRIPAMMFSSASHPSLFELDARRIFSYPGRVGCEGWMFNEQDNIPEVTGSSVSCAATSVALHLGFDPIILIGQDLSFDGGHYYHANGADGDAKAIWDEEQKAWRLTDYSDDMAHTLKDNMPEGGPLFENVMVPGYYGGQVPTSRQFAGFRQWLIDAALDHHDQATMYNCTEGGTHINAMVHCDLRDVLATLPPHGLDIEAIVNDPRIDAAMQWRRPTLTTRFKRLRRELHTAQIIAEQAIKLIDLALQDPQYLPPLQKVEAAFGQVKAATRLVSLMDQTATRQAILELNTAPNLTESLACSRRLYSILCQQIPRLS